ncbi:hypothetical protein KQI88_10575 [Alkaliphilus sp. MSJ-5]|uniref:Uncharacterized protein n=1 Tax=Alkaliphilus flagellatus TaxID=2841507 RepID=A0ABS6G577_9FIRM|nr:hypothetical protein [Alkaliphilus flagellatus]MBU5676862.1 hypothetical protein [Alkaliphilus flagellatus]
MKKKEHFFKKNEHWKNGKLKYVFIIILGFLIGYFLNVLGYSFLSF